MAAVEDVVLREEPAPLYPKPSVGRIVHYVARGSADGVFQPACRAAVITEVPSLFMDESFIDICVLNPQGIFFDSVEYDEHRTPGTWHWPERV